MLSVILTSSMAARRSAEWDCLLLSWDDGGPTGVGREFCSRLGGKVDDSGKLLGEGGGGNVCDDSASGGKLRPTTTGIMVGFGDNCKLEGPLESDGIDCATGAELNVG